MRTPRLPVVDWTDAPADLNVLVRFAERRNLFSARVPSHFKRSLSWFNSEMTGGACLVLCPGRFIQGKEVPMPIEYEAGWNP